MNTSSGRGWLAVALVAAGCAGGSTPTSADSGDGKPDVVDVVDVVAVDVVDVVVVGDRGQDVPVDLGAPIDLGFDAAPPDAGFDAGPQDIGFDAGPTDAGPDVADTATDVPPTDTGPACADAGVALCSGACVNTQTSATHCGGCGRSCCAGSFCSGGRCVTPCPTGWISCNGDDGSPSTGSCFGGTCADIQFDPRHCGACNRACGEGNACMLGACSTRAADGTFIPPPPGRAGALEVVASNLGGVQGLVLTPDARAAFVSATGLGVIWYVDWSFTPARVTRWADGLIGPSQLTFAPGGDLIVAEREGNRVTRIARNPDGTAGARTPFAPAFTGPWGVASDPSGRLLVSNEFGTTVDRIDADGGVTRMVVPAFPAPLDLRFDAAGRLYVGDYGSPLATGQRVFVYNPDLTPLRTLTGFAGPIGLALDTAGNVYAANYMANNVVRVTPANVATAYVTGLGGPHAIAFDPAGALYIDDYATGRLLRFSAAR